MVGASARTASTRGKIAEAWGTQIFETSEALCQETQPDFVINCGGWNTILDVMRPLHQCGVKVLCETPPGWQREQQEEMHAMVQDGLRMQVAEQGWLQPEHHARILFAHSGRLGTLSYGQITGAGYHGYALIRKYLGIGFEAPRIHAVEAKHPIVIEGGRDGLATEEIVKETRVSQIMLQFPDGKLGLLGSTGDHFSTIRKPLVRIRGSHGELTEDGACFLRDYRTPIHHPLQRIETSDLDGRYLQAIQIGDEVYDRNDIRTRLTDDEIAIARSMRLMARYCDTGEEFYSFANAAWDQTISLLVKEATESGTPVQAEACPWIET